VPAPARRGRLRAARRRTPLAQPVPRANAAAFEAFVLLSCSSLCGCPLFAACCVTAALLLRARASAPFCRERAGAPLASGPLAGPPSILLFSLAWPGSTRLHAADADAQCASSSQSTRTVLLHTQSREELEQQAASSRQSCWAPSQVARARPSAGARLRSSAGVLDVALAGALTPAMPAPCTHDASCLVACPAPCSSVS
jgi:hypothetical protein